MAESETVRTEAASKLYGQRWGLAPTDLRLTSGSFVLTAGANGAGKTTLLRLLAGLGKPTGGHVFINGSDPHQEAAVRGDIGIMTHKSLLYENLSATENLQFYARLYGVHHAADRVDQALQQVGLLTRCDQLVSTFSRGMKQRLSLARAGLHQPALYLLDEPFAGLDAKWVEHFVKHLTHLHAMGCTVLIVTHRPETVASIVNYLLVLVDGCVEHNAPWSGNTDALHNRVRWAGQTEI